MNQKKNPQGKSPIKKKKAFVLDVLLPWKPKNSQITISKVTATTASTHLEYIKIHIKSNEALNIIVEMSLHDFAKGITGQGCLPCKLNIE